MRLDVADTDQEERNSEGDQGRWQRELPPFRRSAGTQDPEYCDRHAEYDSHPGSFRCGGITVDGHGSRVSPQRQVSLHEIARKSVPDRAARDADVRLRAGDPSAGAVGRRSARLCPTPAVAASSGVHVQDDPRPAVACPERRPAIVGEWTTRAFVTSSCRGSNDQASTSGLARISIRSPLINQTPGAFRVQANRATLRPHRRICRTQRFLLRVHRNRRTLRATPGLAQARKQLHLNGWSRGRRTSMLHVPALFATGRPGERTPGGSTLLPLQTKG